MDAKPISVTADSYQRDVVSSDLPVVVDFWAPWCGPCPKIGPVLEDLAGQYAGKVRVAKINVDEEQALAGRFNISGIPTLKIFYKGNEAGELVGFPGKEPLEQLFVQLADLSAGAPQMEASA